MALSVQITATFRGAFGAGIKKIQFYIMIFYEMGYSFFFVAFINFIINFFTNFRIKSHLSFKKIHGISLINNKSIKNFQILFKNLTYV